MLIWLIDLLIYLFIYLIIDYHVLNALCRFLEQKHKDHYRIYNLWVLSADYV